MNSSVFSLTVFDDGSGPALHAGGAFTSAGGVAASGIAKWTPGTASWSALGTGMAGASSLHVFALAAYDDDGGGPRPPGLYAGGGFTWAGGVSSERIARWGACTAPCVAPLITTQPQGQTQCEGQPVTFNVEASGTPPFNYQWRKDLADIPGATSSTYTIAAVQPSDAGVYDVVVTNDCGTVTSAGATLTVAALPDVPGGVAASDGTFQDKIRVTWEAVPDATCYQVWRNTGNDPDTAVLLSADPDCASPYDDTSAVVCTNYWYWVAAENACGSSGLSLADEGGRAGVPEVAFYLAAVSTPTAGETTLTPPESIPAVPLGGLFYVELWVSDVGTTNTGMTSAYVDLYWPSGLVTATSVNHGTLFTFGPTGTILPGQVDELGGSQLAPGVGLTPQWARVAYVQMQAQTDGYAVFSLATSTTGVACWGQGAIPWCRVGLDALELVVTQATCAGDLNCDGQIDFADINPFVMYLSNYSAWLTEFAGCNPLNGDINGDGTYGQWSFGDINPFVALFLSGQPPYPCP